MADLFDLGDLTTWLEDPEVDPAKAAIARRVASGWLGRATGLTSWPDPVTDTLYSWALELAAIAYRNPAGFTRVAVDDIQVTYDIERRAAILTEATAEYGTSGAPLGAFPDWDWSWTSTANPCVIL